MSDPNPERFENEGQQRPRGNRITAPRMETMVADLSSAPRKSSMTACRARRRARRQSPSSTSQPVARACADRRPRRRTFGRVVRRRLCHLGCSRSARERIDACWPDQPVDLVESDADRCASNPHPSRRALPMGPHVHARPRRRGARDAPCSLSPAPLSQPQLGAGRQGANVPRSRATRFDAITGIGPPPNALEPMRLADPSTSSMRAPAAAASMA